MDKTEVLVYIMIDEEGQTTIDLDHDTCRENHENEYGVMNALVSYSITLNVPTPKEVHEGGTFDVNEGHRSTEITEDQAQDAG